MSIALLGVVAMQYYFISETYKQKSKLFDESVMAALSSVSNRLEKIEIYEYTIEQRRFNQEKFVRDQELQKRKEAILQQQIDIQNKIKSLQQKQINIENKFRDAEGELRAYYPNATQIDNSFFETYIRRKAYEKYLDIRVEGGISTDMNFIENTIRIGATQRVTPVPAKDDSIRYVIPFVNHATLAVTGYQVATLPPKSSSQIAFDLFDLETKLHELDRRKLQDAVSLEDSVAILGGKDPNLVNQVTLGMTLAKKPLKSRVSIIETESLIKEELLKRDINTPFIIEIRDRIGLVFPSAFEESIADKLSKYSVPLFQGDSGKGLAQGVLTILFPNKRSIITDNMSYLILPMIALFALLVGCFAYTLSIIFKQKKISEMKTDFINNMTHEFKTPVATIMIASESLRDPEIANNQARVSKLANIIYDENVRLGSHIERVLNIAKLEKENLRIERIKVHINPLVESVLDSMHLQLQKADGKIQVNLAATEDIVIGDELHLSNVMFNLVDNAIKYSAGSPDISVKTYNSKGNIVISVSDRGMGMTKDQQEKIFDQFYRIPTGNIHNVKGFGLGLSYVNDIIKRLDGKIHVKSEKDKGTTFEVTLPLKNVRVS